MPGPKDRNRDDIVQQAYEDRRKAIQTLQLVHRRFSQGEKISDDIIRTETEKSLSDAMGDRVYQRWLQYVKDEEKVKTSQFMPE